MSSVGNIGSSTPVVPQAPLTSGTEKPIAPETPLDGVGFVTATQNSSEPIAKNLTGSIRTHFPLEDLGSIDTHDRFAAGFSLDGGSVRLMWINARRVNDQADKRGFEITFFLHGPAIGKMKERMQQKGAQNTSFPFYGAELAPGAAPGKSTLARNGSSWSPGQGQSLMLHSDDKYTVHFVEGAPEALKGAVRIRTYGDDANSNTALAEVISKLGLQHVFAPPTAGSLERFKLARFLWAHKPELLESALWSSFSEIDSAALDKKLEALDLGANHPAWTALDNLSLSDDKVQKRLKLGLLLWSKRPKAFFDWVKADPYSSHGIIPTASAANEYSLNQALAAAGIKQDSPEYAAALAAKMPKAEEVKKFFELGFLIRQAPSAAEELLQRSVDQIPASKLKAVIEGAGIDVSGGRLDKLEFREVYPGYFTAYDPSLPDRLKEKGARYLYSTLDNPERVFEVLTGGQKASMTRFQEGKLIQGKSSSSDFGTGGAFSVFTRLVTDSAIQQAKKQKKAQGGNSYGYGYGTTNFNNWGGSRPYKVILNREILGRTDWYGYNGDNYGRSTGLKAENHAEALIDTINKNYSGSNELMFPVGNDPKFIDYVVCENDTQKQSLISHLTERGIHSFNGKSLNELIRVETSFFEHPQDLDAESYVREACEALELKSAELAARSVAGNFVKGVVSEKTGAAAKNLAAELAPEVVKSLAQSAAGWQASQQVSQVLSQTLAASSLGEIETLALEAAKAASAGVAIDPPAHLASNAKWTVQNQLNNSVNTKAQEIAKSIGPSVAVAAAQAVKAAQPAGADPNAVKQAVRNAVIQAINEQTKAATAAALKTELLDAATKGADQAVRNNALSQARYALANPLAEAAVQAGKSAAQSEGLTAQWLEKVLSSAGPQVKSLVDNNFGANFANYLRSRVQQGAKQRAESELISALGDQAKNAARAAAKEELEATMKNAVETFNQAHPDKKVDLHGPALDALRETALKRADDVARWFTGVEVGTAIDPVLGNAIESAVQGQISADHSALVGATITEILTTTTDTQLGQQLRQRMSTAVNKLVEELAAKRAEQWTAQVAPQLAAEVLDSLASSISTYSFQTIAYNLAEEEAKKVP